jgi:hypothetical protein
VFSHTALSLAGIQPFAGAGYANPVIAPKKKNVTDVFFVLDCSLSMSGLMASARKNLQDQVEVLHNAAGPNDEYYVSVICFSDKVSLSLGRTNINDVGVNRMRPED